MFFSTKGEIVHASPAMSRSGEIQSSHLSKLSLSNLFFKNGREALSWALLYLKRIGALKNNNVLLPAFYCGSTADYLKKHGFNIIWCEVDNDGCFSISHFVKLLDENVVSLVVFCEFFGLGSSKNVTLREICVKYNILIALDRCHSVFSELQETGASFSFFSLRKVASVDYGGVLNFHDKSFLSDKNIMLFDQANYSLKKMSCFSKSLNYCKYLLKRLLVAQKYINIYLVYDCLISKASTQVVSRRIAAPIKACFYPLCGPAEMFVAGSDKLTYIIRRRRENFALLSNMPSVRHYQKFRNMSFESDAPQTLPLVVSNAAALSSYLRKNGVGAYAWPAHDFPQDVLMQPEKFPVASYLRQSILCLPVHQGITNKDILRINFLLESWQG